MKTKIYFFSSIKWTTPDTVTQNFSFPNTIISYISTKLRSTPSNLQKLYSICKYFYQTTKIIPIKIFHLDKNTNLSKMIWKKQVFFDKNLIKNWNFKLQIFDEFVLHASNENKEDDNDRLILSNLLSKFWNCKISLCQISRQNLTVKEFEYLSGYVERISMKDITVRNSNECIIPVEELLRIGKNLKDFFL